ncbi:Ig-like domain-containing protein [Plantactinospora veratri]|uniref:Ig-like domain-containing protein n=1 Tax=Plantactinospora veratri TaxID=1436122 RepID=A0ABU7SMM7_9ACTN
MPSTAKAGARGEALFGDFNADGLQDEAVLGAVLPNLCSTIVTYGAAPGVYTPPVAYTYLTLGGSSTPNCPDIGVAANVDDDPADELWVAWSQGAPATVDFNRLVLQPPFFTPSARYTSTIARPTYSGKAMFSPGGRYSPYAVGPGGLLSYTVEGNIVSPGPVAFCSVDTPTVQIADWNSDGIDSVLLAYTRGCADNSNGVVEIRQDGTTRHLEFDPTGRTTWTARLANANGDRFPDVRTVNQTTGEVSYFINTGSGDFTLTRAPEANTDQITLTTVKPLAIDILANDFASRYAEIIITVPPRYGTVQVLSDRRVVYRPNPTHGRTDRFTYQLVEEGKRSSATVTIRFPD